MAAISRIERSQVTGIHSMAKRSNWASKNPGVVLVFCIVFIVSLGLVSLWLYRQWVKRRARRQRYETTT